VQCCCRLRLPMVFVLVRVACLQSSPHNTYAVVRSREEKRLPKRSGVACNVLKGVDIGQHQARDRTLTLPKSRKNSGRSMAAVITCISAACPSRRCRRTPVSGSKISMFPVL
jgi:hypothetical protein